MFYGKAQTTAEQFKSDLIDLKNDLKIKQESLAYHAHVNQNTISQWLNPEDDRHLPAFQLLLLPKEFVVPIIRKIAAHFHFLLTPQTQSLPVNGSIDDNLLNMNILEGELTKAKDSDPKQVIKWCEKLEMEIATIKAEAIMMGKNK